MMRFLVLRLLALLFVSLPGHTEDVINQPGGENFLFVEHSLRVLIVARVSESGDEAVWNVESAETTIPGRGVGVKLVGGNLIVAAQFTPYLQQDGSLLLVAQGQVWVSSPPLEEVKYLTTLKNIPIRLGERVFFFPLGVKGVERESENVYNIELEIKILPVGASVKDLLP